MPQISNIYSDLACLLDDLQSALLESNLWSHSEPSKAALSSQLPFCCDTMHFHTWLQFVFLPKMRELISTQAELPQSLLLLPMAEETLSPNRKSRVMEAIQQIDELFSQRSDV